LAIAAVPNLKLGDFLGSIKGGVVVVVVVAAAVVVAVVEFPLSLEDVFKEPF
jgi:hypothetical protein